MKDYFEIPIETSLNKLEMYNILVSSLPDFVWKMGNGDYDDGYITGRNDGALSLKIWLEPPMMVSVVFSFKTLNQNEKDLYSRVLESGLNKIGKVKLDDIKYRS